MKKDKVNFHSNFQKILLNVTAIIYQLKGVIWSLRASNKLWTILKEMGIPDHLTCFLRKICLQVKKQQLELDVEQQIGSKSGKEYVLNIVTLLN